MFKKPNDPEYSGVDPEKIKAAKPKINPEMLERYCYYQKERTKIYYKKEVLKLPAPWSDDTMFQNFKFTNTKRYLDRESKNLINGLLERSDVTLENKLLNCVAFRLINKWLTFDILPEKYVDFSRFDDKEYQQYLKSAVDATTGKVPLFTDAYFVSGVIRSMRLLEKKANPESVNRKSSPKDSVMIIFRYINSVKDKIIALSKMTEPNDIVVGVANIYGLGKFTAYQAFADWTYIKEYPFSDNSCVEVGPGTERGLNHFFDDFGGLTHKEAVYWIRDNIDRVAKENGLEWDVDSWFSFLPEEYRYWGLQDITNSMCEFSKSYKIWTPEQQQENYKQVRGFAGAKTLLNEFA